MGQTHLTCQSCWVMIQSNEGLFSHKDDQAFRWVGRRPARGLQAMTKVTQAHIDARTRDILEAGMRLFARKGYAATTTQEIAVEAGISAGAIYRYYPSKEHLLRAVFEFCVGENSELFEQASAGVLSPLEALTRTGLHAWEHIKEENASEHTILVLETLLAAVRQPDELAASGRQMFQATVAKLEGLVKLAQEAGEIDPHVDAHSLALALEAAYLGSRVLALGLGEEVDPVLRHVQELVATFALAPTSAASAQ